MRKLFLSLVVLCLLVGCKQAKETVETTSDAVEIENANESYYKMIKITPSETRNDYYNKFSQTSDLVSIGRNLQIIASDYFSVSDYYMSEGQYLSSDDNKELRAYYNSKEHPYSLELGKNEKFEGISGLDMVEDVHEQDYYKKSNNQYKLAGVAFSVVLDPKRVDGKDLATSFSTNQLKSFGEKCIKKLYSVIQEKESLSKIKNVPILIAVYQATDASTSSVDGRYILKSYCDGSVGKISSVNHRNVIFTSTQAKDIDPTTYDEFTTIKNNLKEASIESSSLIGYGKYIDNKINSMTIEAHLNIKTYTEVLYLTSVLESNIKSRFSNDFTINVLVYSQDELMAMIIKNRGDDPITTFLH